MPRDRGKDALRDAHPAVRQQAIQNLGPAHAAEGTEIELELIGERQDAKVAASTTATRTRSSVPQRRWRCARAPSHGS